MILTNLHKNRFPQQIQQQVTKLYLIFSFFFFYTEQAADRVIDFNVCFQKISFSVYNRRIKNGCRKRLLDWILEVFSSNRARNTQYIILFHIACPCTQLQRKKENGDKSNDKWMKRAFLCRHCKPGCHIVLTVLEEKQRYLLLFRAETAQH